METSFGCGGLANSVSILILVYDARPYN